MSSEENVKRQEKSKKKLNLNFPETRFMRFLGGKDLIFGLFMLILIGIVIFILIKFLTYSNRLLLFLTL